MTPDEVLDAIRAFVQRPKGKIEVGSLNGKIRDALRTEARSAFLSSETIAKQAENHPDLLPDDYLLIPLALADPTLVASQREFRLVLFRTARKVIRIAAKTTEDRQEVYVTSFHFTDLRKAQRFLRHNHVLFGQIKDLGQ